MEQRRRRHLRKRGRLQALKTIAVATNFVATALEHVVINWRTSTALWSRIEALEGRDMFCQGTLISHHSAIVDKLIISDTVTT
jgi:hypothetical protein